MCCSIERRENMTRESMKYKWTRFHFHQKRSWADGCAVYNSAAAKYIIQKERASQLMQFWITRPTFRHLHFGNYIGWNHNGVVSFIAPISRRLMKFDLTTLYDVHYCISNRHVRCQSNVDITYYGIDIFFPYYCWLFSTLLQSIKESR